MKARHLLAAVLALALSAPALAQQPGPNPTGAGTTPAGITPPVVESVKLPAEYVIGVGDVLTVAFWREKEMSADVIVRPDGMVTLPLLNDIRASGLAPEAFRDKVVAAAKSLVEDPAVTVGVKQINSRKVYVNGEVVKPGNYDLGGPTTVMQILAIAGGVKDFAKKDQIVVIRTEADGTQTAHKYNYKEVIKGKNLKQNILLLPGDVVVVP